MKLTELRPCDRCRGKIAPCFYVVRVSSALVTPAAGRVLGLSAAMGGLRALRIAEALSPDTDEAVMVFGEKDTRLWTELLLCQACAVLEGFILGQLIERRNAALELEPAKLGEDADDVEAAVASGSEGKPASSPSPEKLSHRDAP